MKSFRDYLEESSSVEDVLKNVQHQVKTFDKPKTDKLFNTMVINKMKEKRNKIKNATKKKEYQKVIDTLEKGK